MPADAAVPTIENLTGLWTRSLIAWPDGRRDTTTQVLWLQGPGFYADLRQPEGMPDFSRTRRLADVTDEQLTWLARQEAFAGELHFDGDCFEWKRDIDMQPRAARADRGHLRFERDTLVEEGEQAGYIEHWHRSPHHGAVSAARLHASSGHSGYLLRLGPTFVYARGNLAQLPPNETLLSCVRSAPSAEAARRLVDFEVSLGRIGPEGWRIERSSLPFRCGQRLEARATGPSALSVIESDFSAGLRVRPWQIVALRGRARDAAALTAFYPDEHPNLSNPMPGARS